MANEEDADWEEERARRDAIRKRRGADRRSPDLPDGSKKWQYRRGDADEANDERYGERYS